MNCSICYEDKDTKYLDLYVFGSEGIRVCKDCEREIDGLILNLALEKQRKRKEYFLKFRRK